MSDRSLDYPLVVLRRQKADELYFLLAGIVALLISIGIFVMHGLRFEAIRLGVIGCIVGVVGLFKSSAPPP